MNLIVSLCPAHGYSVTDRNSLPGQMITKSPGGRPRPGTQSLKKQNAGFKNSLSSSLFNSGIASTTDNPALDRRPLDILTCRRVGEDNRSESLTLSPLHTYFVRAASCSVRIHQLLLQRRNRYCSISCISSTSHSGSGSRQTRSHSLQLRAPSLSFGICAFPI